jgi:integrase
VTYDREVGEPGRRYDGIDVRHARACRSRDGARCSCSPSYRAEAYDRRSGKKVRRTFPTLTAARAWRSDAQGDLRRGVRRGPSGITLRRAGEDWITGARDGSIRNRSGELYKPSTRSGYEAALRSRIFPAVGGLKLEDVTRAELQQLVDRMLADGADPSTIRNALMPVRVIFRRLVGRGVVALNPAAGLELPASRGRRDRIASPEEAAALLAAIPTVDDRAVWATAMYAGLRAGELQALEWQAIDLAAGTIAVERAWDPKACEFVAPKSRAGRRRVPIAAALRDYVLAHKLDADGEGLAFARPDGRPFLGAALRRRALAAWKTAGLTSITLHECRHTFASLMIAAGVNAKALSTYMGHANIGITMDTYGHLMPGNEDEAAGLLDAYLDRADTAARKAALEG